MYVYPDFNSRFFPHFRIATSRTTGTHIHIYNMYVNSATREQELRCDRLKVPLLNAVGVGRRPRGKFVRCVFVDAAATSTSAELACLLVFFLVFALVLCLPYMKVSSSYWFFLFLLFFYTSTAPRVCPTAPHTDIAITHNTLCGVLCCGLQSEFSFLCLSLSLPLSLFFHSCILHLSCPFLCSLSVSVFRFLTVCVCALHLYKC